MGNQDRKFLLAHIDRWKNEIKELQDKIDRMQKCLRDLKTPDELFVCEQEEERHSICPGCSYAAPQWDKYNHSFGLPRNVMLKEYPDNKRTCTQWEKKEWKAICGCYGKEECACGYSQNHCSSPVISAIGYSQNHCSSPVKAICPYCGKPTVFSIFERSPMLKFSFLASPPLIKDAES